MRERERVYERRLDSKKDNGAQEVVGSLRKLGSAMGVLKQLEGCPSHATGILYTHSVAQKSRHQCTFQTRTRWSLMVCLHMLNESRKRGPAMHVFYDSPWAAGTNWPE